MDFDYAPPPPGKRPSRELGNNSKRHKPENDFSDLPTHLPNTAQQVVKPVEISEEPELKKEHIFIEGTNISLQTDEDIAKWIAERRKNWPTRRNVEQKLKEKQELLPPKPTPNVCKFFSKTGRCKFGTKCKNLHEAAGTTTINGLAVAIPQRYKQAQDGLLYKKLVQRDLYEHENNVVIDFIEFLDAQKLIDREASV